MTDPLSSKADRRAKVGRNLRAVALSLSDIAVAAGRDAEAATAAVRNLSETARETASLASELAAAAAQIEAAVRDQASLLREAELVAGDSLGVVDGLRRAAEGIGSIAATIGTIAGTSRLLALNARIEAARSGEGSRGFSVVANEMSTLAQATLSATRDIDTHAGTIHGDVGAARSAIETQGEIVEREQALIAEIVLAVDQQKTIAKGVAELTEVTRQGVEDSAAAIGRVASSATAAGLLARQIVRAADALDGDD